MTALATHSDLDEQATGFATHEVMNQPSALEDYDLYSDDKPLRDAVHVFGADWAADHLKQTGVLVGSAKVQHLARQANRHLPELRTHDRFGNRVDIVDFHPAYHELMGLIFGCETHSFAWTHERPGAHVARAALSYLWNQGENGICCPMGMTFASIPALAARCGAARRVGPSHQSARLRSPRHLRQGQGRHHRRHGDDGEAGRLRPARDHDDGASLPRRNGGRVRPTSSPATSGSSRCR